MNKLNFNTNAMCDEAHAKIPYLGISIRSLIDKPGMTVLLVNSESPAATCGVKVGDIVIKVNNKEVNRIEDYYKAMSEIKSGDTVEIEVERYHELKTISVKL